MSKKKVMSSFVEVTDETPIITLSIKDQIRVMMNKFTQDDARELENADAFAIDEAQRKSNLSSFIRRATKPIREGKARSVSLSISSEFESVLDEVLESRSISQFYDVRTHKPDVPYNLDFYILVRLEVKNN